jgi:hypothetical protein
VLQLTGLKALGIVVDADDKPENRQQRINQICQNLKIDLNKNLAQEGMIIVNLFCIISF